MKDTKKILLLILVTLAVLAPFLTKPFNMDDPFYIKMAQHIISDPLKPYSFSINWSGELRDVWQRNEATFPPLIPYYIALIIKAFGLKEWILHLFFLPFPLISAVSMFYLAKKFSREPLFPALLFAGSPVFLVSATSIMLDVPMTAFFLAAFAALIYGADKDSKKLMFLSAVFAGAAFLIKYTALIFVPLAIVYLLSAGKKKYILYALLPLLPFFAWCLHNYAVYGGIHFLRSSQHIGKGITIHKILAMLTFTSGCLFFPLFSYAMIKRREGIILSLAVSSVFVFALRLFDSQGDALLFLVLSLGTVLFLFKVINVWRSLDGFLLAWFFAGLFAVFFLEPWVAGRYFLILLAPAALLFDSMIDFYGIRMRKLLMASALASALFVGMFLAAADSIWAHTYPAVTEYFRQKGYDEGYFVGHFGFQYYMEKAGMKALDIHDRGITSGYVIIALVPDPQKPDEDIFRILKRIERKSIPNSFPVRVMNPWSRAGFYSSFWGIFPFALSDAPLDEFIIYRIE